MPYVRKTRDTWQLHVNYGQGWEHEVTEFSRRDAQNQRRTYRETVPQYPLKIVTKRELILPGECRRCGAELPESGKCWNCEKT